MLNNPQILSKYVAILVLASVFAGAAIVAVIDLVRGQAVPVEIASILTAAVTYAVGALQLERGVTLTNGDTAVALKALPGVLTALQSTHASPTGGTNGSAPSSPDGAASR